jgi:hypothetical protein
LAGRVLAIDTSSPDWKHTSIPLLKPQSDQTTTPAEASLNPDGLWRRAGEEWEHGAGQVIYDRPDSDKKRFFKSKGIDPWTQFQFGLLPDTDTCRISNGAVQRLVTTGPRIYVADNNALLYSENLSAWSTVSGTPGSTIGGIASDGFSVYIATGATGIYKTDTNTAAAASFVTGTVGGSVGYTKGRLLVSNLNSVYNITGAGALPGALLTHPNTNFRWVGYTGGPTHIYLAGFSGDKSIIYKTTIKADGTALDAPTVAGELPDGELVTGIDSYLGFIFIGTTKGARFCQVDQDGSLSISAPIETDGAVYCFEGQDRYVWFGWNNYDGTSTGLGRLSLVAFTESTETQALKPAYASDLMATGHGNVYSVCTFLDKRVFSVGGLGVFCEADVLVPSGVLETGKITFGIPDYKIALLLDIRTLPLNGNITVEIAPDSETYEPLGVLATFGSVGDQLPIIDLIAERIGLRFTLTSDVTGGPVVTRYTLKSTPSAVDGAAEYIIVPFLLRESIDLTGQETYCNVQQERDAIKLLRRSREIVTYQEATDAYAVIVDAYEWRPEAWSKDPDGGYGTPNGIMLTQLKAI